MLLEHRDGLSEDCCGAIAYGWGSCHVFTLVCM